MLRPALGRGAGRSEHGWAWREPELARADGCDERPANRSSAPGRRSTTSSAMSRFHHLAGDLGLIQTLRLTLLPGSNDSGKVAR
jgi:hypothetical protein